METPESMLDAYKEKQKAKIAEEDADLTIHNDLQRIGKELQAINKELNILNKNLRRK